MPSIMCRAPCLSTSGTNWGVGAGVDDPTSAVPAADDPVSAPAMGVRARRVSNWLNQLMREKYPEPMTVLEWLRRPPRKRSRKTLDEVLVHLRTLRHFSQRRHCRTIRCRLRKRRKYQGLRRCARLSAVNYFDPSHCLT
jgi:hypothetical protein